MNKTVLKYFSKRFCFLMNYPLEIKTKLVLEDELSTKQIKSIVKLINQVYLITESDFWPQNGAYKRIDVKKLSSHINNNELIIAKIEEEIVGAVHVYHIKGNICGFGMLVASPEKRGIGIGTALMRNVEDWAVSNKYNYIQLELLKPVKYKHPNKEFLNTWYRILGYKFISKCSYAQFYPEQAHLLKIPCNFEIYQKNLKN